MSSYNFCQVYNFWVTQYGWGSVSPLVTCHCHFPCCEMDLLDWSNVIWGNISEVRYSNSHPIEAWPRYCRQEREIHICYVYHQQSWWLIASCAIEGISMPPADLLVSLWGKYHIEAQDWSLLQKGIQNTHSAEEQPWWGAACAAGFLQSVHLCCCGHCVHALTVQPLRLRWLTAKAG